MRNGTCIGMDVQRVFSTAPLGTVLSYAGQIAPYGYLLCDGASYLVKDYPDLYAVIGNTYGGDDTNFNVPNLIDKFIQGSNTSGTEKEAGLPNITGSISNADAGQNDQFLTDSTSSTVKTEGALAITAYKNRSSMSNGTDSYTTPSGFNFDASRSNAIYGNSDTVQPPALTMVYIIKAFHTNEGTDSGVSDDVVEYVDSKIDDNTTDENSVWSSQKTSDEIVKKQENIFKKHIINVRAGEANRYVLLASCKVSNLSLHNEPIILSGVMGANNDAGKSLFEASVSFKTYTTYDTIFTGYINKNIFSVTDMFATFDESTNTVYLYLDMCRVWSIASFDITIPQRNAEYYGLTIADVNSDKQSNTFIGTEIARMSTSPNVKVLAGLDDATSSTTSTYSSSKIDEKYGSLTFASEGSTRWLKLKLGTSSKFQPIVVSDQYGGKVEILGMTNDGTYKPVKLVRHSYGDWTTHSATDYTTTADGDANYKIRRLLYYPTDSCYYLEIRQWAIIKVEGNSTAELVASLPADASEMTLIPESQFASKKDIDGTIIRTTATDSEYYAITYSDDYDDPANQNILIQYKRSNFPPSTYIFSAVSYATNTRETVSVAKISNNFAGTTYDLRFYIDKDNKTVYLKMPSYSSVSLQNLAFKSKAVAYTKVDAIPDTATTLAVAEYATKADLGSNVPMTEITFTNSTNWSNSSGNLKTFYMVRNGWCFLHVVAHCNKVANDNNSVVYSGLPMPPFQVYGKFVGEDNTYEPCNLTVATNGQMFLRGGTAGKDYSFTYTYPVV